jgi:hypothetical protein
VTKTQNSIREDNVCDAFLETKDGVIRRTKEKRVLKKIVLEVSFKVFVFQVFSKLQIPMLECFVFQALKHFGFFFFYFPLVKHPLN